MQLQFPILNLRNRGQKNDSDLALQRVNDLLSTCQTDFSDLTQICQDWENGVSEQSKTLAKRIF